MDDQTRSDESDRSRTRVEGDCRQLFRHPEGYTSRRSLVWHPGQSNIGILISKSTHAESARRHIPHPTLRRFKVGPYVRGTHCRHRIERCISTSGLANGDDKQWRVVDNERFGLDWISAGCRLVCPRDPHLAGCTGGDCRVPFRGSKLHCWMPRESLEKNLKFTRDIIEPYRIQKKKWDDSTPHRRKIRIAILTDRRPNLGSYPAFIMP